MHASRRTTEMIEQRGLAPATGPDVRVDYYTSQPAPTQWVAVATISVDPRDTFASAFRTFVVGVGASEDCAIADMAHRISALACHGGAR
jgi:hypothetical protein